MGYDEELTWWEKEETLEEQKKWDELFAKTHRTQVCFYCGKEFTYKYKSGPLRRYCSEKCKRRYGGLKTVKKRNDLDTEFKNWKSEILHLYKYSCAICGWRATTDDKYTYGGKCFQSMGCEIHHIYPVCKGGQSSYNNLILLCPNHHKQANMGLISENELKKYLVKPPTLTEREYMKCQAISNSVDRVANAIFQ